MYRRLSSPAIISRLEWLGYVIDKCLSTHMLLKYVPTFLKHTHTHMHTHTQDCQKKVGHTLSLTSYLIKPVQRILKYPLLLEDLNKKFDWSDHPGQLKLKRALGKMSSVAVQINTAFNEQVS